MRAGRGGSIKFVNPWTVSSYNATYATALGAVTTNQYFGWIADSGNVAHIYQKTASATGSYVGTIPWGSLTSTPDTAFQDAVETLKVRMPVMPYSPAIDIASVDSFYTLNTLVNRASSAAPINLLGTSAASELLGVLALSNTTVTLADGDDPERVGHALNITCSAGVAGYAATGVFIPCGHWKFRFRYKASSASNLRFGWDSVTATLTADGTWRSIELTMPHKTAIAEGDPSTFYFCRSNTSNDAIDITIDELQIVPFNSVDLITPSDIFGSWSGCGMIRLPDFSVTTKSGSYYPGFVMGISPTAESRAAMSIVMALKKTGTDLSFESYVTKGAWGSLNVDTTPFFGKAGNATHFAGGTTNFQTGSIEPGDEWVILGVSAGASGTSVWVDGVKLYEKSTAWGGLAVRAIEFLNATIRAFPYRFPGQIFSSSIWWSKLTDTEMQAALSAMKSRVVKGSGTVDLDQYTLISDGDSITIALDGYAQTVGLLYSPTLRGRNYAVGGSAIIHLEARQADVIQTIADVISTGRTPIVSVMVGTNDFVDASSLIVIDEAAYYNRVGALLASYRAAGAKVIWGTILPKQIDDTVPYGPATITSTVEAHRPVFNSMILANAIADGYADATMNFAVAPMDVWNATYYTDAVHPNLTGHGLMKTIFKSAIDSVMV